MSSDLGPWPLGDDLFVQRHQKWHEAFSGYTVFGAGKTNRIEMSPGQAWAMLTALLEDIELLAEATGNSANVAALDETPRFALLAERVGEALALSQGTPPDLASDFDRTMQILESGVAAVLALKESISRWEKGLAEVQENIEEAAARLGEKDTGYEQE